MIVQFFGQQTEARRDKWRQIYELKRQQEATGLVEVNDELVEEISFLKRISEQEDRLSRTYDLFLSLFGFVTFWMLGAVVYHAIEGWSFGNSVYYCYVTFFTIGFVSDHFTGTHSAALAYAYPFLRATSLLPRQQVCHHSGRIIDLFTDKLYAKQDKHSSSYTP